MIISNHCLESMGQNLLPDFESTMQPTLLTQEGVSTGQGRERETKLFWSWLTQNLWPSGSAANTLVLATSEYPGCHPFHWIPGSRLVFVVSQPSNSLVVIHLLLQSLLCAQGGLFLVQFSLCSPNHVVKIWLAQKNDLFQRYCQRQQSMCVGMQWCVHLVWENPLAVSDPTHKASPMIITPSLCPNWFLEDATPSLKPSDFRPIEMKGESSCDVVLSWTLHFLLLRDWLNTQEHNCFQRAGLLQNPSSYRPIQPVQSRTLHLPLPTASCACLHISRDSQAIPCSDTVQLGQGTDPN